MQLLLPLLIASTACALRAVPGALRRLENFDIWCFGRRDDAVGSLSRVGCRDAARGAHALRDSCRQLAVIDLVAHLNL